MRWEAWRQVGSQEVAKDLDGEFGALFEEFAGRVVPGGGHALEVIG
jgi:hypothetical protein